MLPSNDSTGITQGSDSEHGPFKLQVGSSIKDRRLDKYLHGRFTNFSRRFIQDAIKAGTVKVNGKIGKPSLKLSPGDEIDMTLPEPPSKDILPEDIPLNIIYEDSCIIVLNKQSDMIVHPARGNTHGTLVNALAFYSDKLSSGLGEFRPGIVHRLDKNTTGVMVVAKDDGTQWKIAKQFERRQVNKNYLAIVHGTPELTADCIKVPLGIHPRHREKYAIRPDSGKESITFYEVLESFRGFSLLKMTLLYIKHPIVGDGMYGGRLVYPWQLADAEPAVQQPVINRVALHAHTLEFKHPVTEKMVKFEAPLPEDMQNFLDMLRKHRKK